MCFDVTLSSEHCSRNRHGWSKSMQQYIWNCISNISGNNSLMVMMKMAMWISCLSFYRSYRTTWRVREPGPIISDYLIARGTTDLIKHITSYNPDDQVISVHLSRITEENTSRFDETRRLLYQSRDDTSGTGDRTSNWSIVNHVARCDTQKFVDFSARRTLSRSNRVISEEHAQTFVLLKTGMSSMEESTISRYNLRYYLIDLLVNLVI